MPSTVDLSFNPFNFQMSNNNGDPQGYQFTFNSNFAALNQNVNLPPSQTPLNQYYILEQAQQQVQQPQLQQSLPQQLPPQQQQQQQQQQPLLPQYQVQTQTNQAMYMSIPSNDNYSTSAASNAPNNSYDFMNSNHLQSHLLQQSQIQQQHPTTSPLSTSDHSLIPSARHSFSHFQSYNHDVPSHKASVSSINYDLNSSFPQSHSKVTGHDDYYPNEEDPNHNELRRLSVSIKEEMEDNEFPISNVNRSRTNYYTKSEDFKRSLLTDVTQTIAENLSLEDLAKKFKLTKSQDGKGENDDDSLDMASLQEKDKYRNIFCVRCLFEIAVEHDQVKIDSGAINNLNDSVNGNQIMSIHESPRSRLSKDCVQRSHIYAAYHYVSESVNVEPFGPSIVGKLIRIAFPNIKTKRLGTRGKSKYHYTGIRIKSKFVKILANTNDKDIDKLIRVSTVSPRTTSLVHGNESEVPNRKNSVDIRDSNFGSPLSEIDKMTSSYTYKSISKLSVDDIKNFDGYQSNMSGSMFKQCILSGEPSLAVDQLISYSSKTDQGFDDQFCELDLKLYYSTLNLLMPITYKKMNQGFVTMLKQTATEYPALLKEKFTFLSSNSTGSSEYYDRRIKAGLLFAKLIKKMIKAQDSCFNVGRILDNMKTRTQMIQDLKNMDTESMIELDINSNEYDDQIKDVLTKDLPHFFNFTLSNPTNEVIDLLNDKIFEPSESSYSESVLLNDYIDRQVSESQTKTMKSVAEFFGSMLFSKFGNVNLKMFELIMSGNITTCILKSFNASNSSNNSFSYWWLVKLWVDEWVSLNCEMLLLKLKLKQAQSS